MTAPARLLALRLQGFKSFAERTVVEFGPGISAVVGPNGSGKSNLADGLRWALGEQGRALRSRKAEDVIWAGSERRAALGMADVTLVLDNADGLLPVDYTVLELGRRLYRSGENDYLLNRQRVRLRDLVDLLDAANLADNAFLFIGQGMVDQALSLRPEERRPLFEEVAGVRRHERRRRKAEEQLGESETNLARVEDVLAELRPQARRLAAQAEQQTTRATAGSDLAAALIAAAHARWHEAAARLADASTRRERAIAETQRAQAELERTEAVGAAIADELTTRVALEAERRDAHETARTALTRLQLREARLLGDQEALARDRRRLTDERAGAEANLAVQRRALAHSVPAPDPELEAAVAAADRSLADALAEVGQMRAARGTHGEQLSAIRRIEAARQADLATARRRHAEAERRTAEEAGALDAAARRRASAQAAAATAATALADGSAVESRAADARERARAAAEDLDHRRQAAVEQSAAVAASLAALTARLEAFEARLREEEARGIAQVARRHGGRRLDEDLGVDAALRAAVETALADAAQAYVVERRSVPAIAAERGMLVVGEAAAVAVRQSNAERGFLERVGALGGGSLRDAVRRDPTGAATALLARAAWLPDLEACLSVQSEIPPGWLVVTRDGSAAVAGLSIALGATDSSIERRAQAERLRADVTRLAAERTAADAAAREATTVEAHALAALDQARAEEIAAAAARRRAEESERLAARDLEAAAREAEWLEAQAARLAGEVTRAHAAVEALDRTPGSGDGSAPADADDAGAIAAWQTRADELRGQRDRLAGELAARDRARREAESVRARAEAAVAMDEDRIARADREAAALSERAVEVETEREALRGELAAATSSEATARAVLGELRAADAVDRERLASAERAATEARVRLRGGDERLRAADRSDLEARLGIDALREQLLVELAGLGEVGVTALAAAAGGDAHGTDDAAGPPDTNGSEADDAATLERALDVVAARWAATAPDGDPPSGARLATLRRRYHELGAANPFAVEEYAAVRERLETLDRQQDDLRAAIAKTRQLIGELDAMIAEQFSTTFRALEAAFDRQFNQLFGGGYARLALTEPNDLSATGVEIVARPPGKKAQALAMLSGGERALTAVALLFAMLEVRPVPFCVLDEVDAALDEANVGRFSEALRVLAARTQFIVITHNRGTIEAADALYGVTVGDDSVSRVISLRLDEATAIAERREPEAAGIGIG